MPPKKNSTYVLRAAIYARYSSDRQREESIDDQIESCRRYCESRGFQVVDIYTDAAVSGASTKDRPGYERLRGDAELRRFDVVVAEAVDRLSRQLADVATIHDRLTFLGIRLHTVSQGELNPLLAGVMGAVAQSFLSELRDKTRRGLRGKVLAGLSAGGIGYGYRADPGRKGGRQIDEREAEVVRRIFRDYAAGLSPRTIAANLNTEGVPGPGGRPWGDTTIRGQAERGTGILNNMLYAGQLAWDRCSYVKDPATGRRVARPKPREEWEIIDAPESRIVDVDLWEAVKARQGDVRTTMARDEEGNALNRAHRRVHLLSGLIVCGECGAPFVMVDGYRYGCNRTRSKGTCGNTLKLKRADIEKRVVHALRHRLLQSDAIEDAVERMRLCLKESSTGTEAKRAILQRRLADVEQGSRNIVRAIEDGFYSREMKVRATRLEAERDALLQELADLDAAVHPELPDAAVLASGYRLMMDHLLTLTDQTEYPEGTAFEAIRQTIERIVVTPNGERTALDAVMTGRFAGIVRLWQEGESKDPAVGAAGSTTSVVAGAGFEPAAFRL